MAHISKKSLIEYAERSSGNSKKDADLRHLQDCPRCFTEGLEWSWLFDSLRLPALEKPPDYVTRQSVALFQREKPMSLLRKVLATVTFDSALSPEACGVRGTSDARQLRLCGADADIHLRISSELKSIAGQILEVSSGGFLPGTPVRMVRGKHVVCSTVTDELGQFDFNECEKGKLRFEADLPSGVTLQTIIFLGDIAGKA